MKVSLITTAALAVVLYTGPQITTATAQQANSGTSATQSNTSNSNSSSSTKAKHSAKAKSHNPSDAPRDGVNNSMQDPNNQEGNGSTLGTAAKGTPNAAVVGKKNPGIDSNSGDPKAP